MRLRAWIATVRAGSLLLAAGAAGWSQQVTFQGGVSLTSDKGPIAMLAGDFNRDGKADIVMSNSGAKQISIALGRGDGSFQTAKTYNTPPGCVVGYLASGDFNNDRKLDVLAGCQFGTQLLVFPGNGDGSLGSPVATQLSRPAFMGTIFLGVVSQGIGPVVADFDLDGNADLALMLSTDPAKATLTNPAIYILRGKGDGTFGSPVQVAIANASVTSIVSADFNRDGKPDLAVLTLPTVAGSGTPQNLAIQLGNGDGTFRAGFTYPWTGPSFGLTTVDVNSDGFVDLLSTGVNFAVEYAISTTTVWLGRGDGTFTQTYSMGDADSILSLGGCVGDLRGIGQLDIAAAVATWPRGDAAFGVHTGNGDGTFQGMQLVVNAPGAFPLAFACADFNGDGLADIAYSSVPLSLISNVFNKDPVTSSLDSFNQILLDLPAGTFTVLLNNSPALSLTFNNVNAASFVAGPLAVGSIATATGRGIAPGTFTATTSPPPTTMGGISLNVRDSAGGNRLAPLFYVSPTQINYVIPEGTVPGPTTIAIVGTHNNYSSQQQIATVGPGVFGAAGLAVGSVLTVNASGQTVTNLVTLDGSGNLAPNPIDVGSESDQVYLLLFGTGIRHHGNPVTVSLGTTRVTAAYAGAQGVYMGEDQINILLPQSLRGAGLISVTLDVDGQKSNAVKIFVK